MQHCALLFHFTKVIKEFGSSFQSSQQSQARGKNACHITRCEYDMKVFKFFSLYYKP